MIPANSSNVSAREQPFFMPLLTNPIAPGKTGIAWADVGGGLTNKVKYRLPGGVYTNGVIANIVEKGFGIYAYQFTQAQTVTQGFTYLDADDVDCQSWTGSEQISSLVGGIKVGETDDNARELPFHLPNSSDPSIPTLGQSFSVGDVKLFLPGGSSFVNADQTRVVEKGVGDYALRLTDAQVTVAGKIYLYVSVSGSQPWSSWADITDGGGGGGGQVLSLTTGPISRWTPVLAQVRITGGTPFIRYVSNELKLWIYDPVDGFTANFKDRSTVQVNGNVMTFSILPCGGWWTKQFRLKFIAGTELST